MKLYKYKLKQLLCKHEYKYSGMTWDLEGEPRYKHRCTKCKKSIYK